MLGTYSGKSLNGKVLHGESGRHDEIIDDPLILYVTFARAKVLELFIYSEQSAQVGLVGVSE